MNLEHRYIVFKITDLEKYLDFPTLSDLRHLSGLINHIRNQNGRPLLDGVFIEADWPEFEPVRAELIARIKRGCDQLADKVEVVPAEAALEKINALFKKMMCSARVVADENNNVTAYRINTGAVHEMLGTLKEAGQDAFIPSFLSTWDMDFYGRCWSAFRFSKDLTEAEVARIMRIELGLLR